ncbi:hypothetical protein [Desemzia sp. FAM 23991]|uniref:hypothetical protein n=1 Tax=unclassified Desemzia TaxID=2685243 RepID=UPI003887BF19
MDTTIQSYFKDLSSTDKEKQLSAYHAILKITEEPVDWAYEVWENLKSDLKHKNNHRRSRAAQFLASLAISDPENRMLTDFSDVWKVTYDEKFVTARHALQSIWKIALAGKEQKGLVLQYLTNRFRDCVVEKNYTLTRFDIIEDLKKLYLVQSDENLKNLSLELIESVDEPKYKKKYLDVWK